MKERELDLGIVGGHAVGPGEECLAAGLLDELVVVVPPGHAWAKRPRDRAQQLADHPLLMREEGSATRRVTERALQQAGIKFRTGMELDHTEAIKQAIMAGLGVALVSVYAIRGEIATGRLCALTSSTTKPEELRRPPGRFMELLEQTARRSRSPRSRGAPARGFGAA